MTHEPVQQAMNRIRQLSADEEARRLAFVRERALHDEVSPMKPCANNVTISHLSAQTSGQPRTPAKARVQ